MNVSNSLRNKMRQALTDYYETHPDEGTGDPLRGTAAWESFGGYREAPPVVRKLGQTVVISEDVAMDAGLIPDTRPPHAPSKRRFRDLVRARWWKLREDVGFWIAGEDPRDHDCC